MRVFNLGYTTVWQPWKSAGIKTWLHNDAIFKYLRRRLTKKGVDLNIHVLYPQQGLHYYKEVLEGKTSRMMNSVVEFSPIFYDEPYEGDLDAILIEFSTLKDIEMYDGRVYTVKDQMNYYINLINKMYEGNKHIIWYDADAYLYLGGITGRYSNHGYEIYKEVFRPDYENQTLITPMEDHPLKGEFKNFLFVPFNIDKEKINDYDSIKKKSERGYISKYVGNNYMRDHFHDYFCNLAEYGNIIVHGSGWGKYKNLNPNIDYAGRFALTAEKSREYYQDSVIGLYGNPDEFKPYKHYTLRIREFVEAGCFIIPEDTYIKDHIIVPGFEFTISDLNNKDKVEKLINLSDEEYRDLIKKQRDIIMKFFDCELYIDGYIKALGLNKESK